MPEPTADTPPVFYSLPAEYLEEGMSTDDKQDIIAVHQWAEAVPVPHDGEVVTYDVYTPADDPAEDTDRRCSPDGRIRPVGARVELAVFPNTQVDGTTHEHAIIHPPA